MDRYSTSGVRLRRVVVVFTASLVLGATLALTAPPAQAYIESMHGGITTCDPCHLNNHTLDPPVNEFCITCHTGFDVAQPSLTCWTCHAPGQDMDGARSDAACTSVCHHFDGTSSIHAQHPDRATTCSTCHTLSASVTDPNGSPHHTKPPALPPSVTGVFPSAGLVGSSVTLTGSLLSGASAVTFDGVPATEFTVPSSTRIVAVVPVGATSGPIAVVTSRGIGSSLANFVVLPPPAPAVTGFAPLSGRAGSTVTLTGSGFGDATAVLFDGVPAVTFGVVSPTQITAVVPSAATTGTITVATPYGSGASGLSFTVLTVATSRVTLRVSGTPASVGRAVKATGVVSPGGLTRRNVRLRLQIRRSGQWVGVKTVSVTAKLSGAYGWSYTPTRKGLYRLQATVAATATSTAAASQRVCFRAE